MSANTTNNVEPIHKTRPVPIDPGAAFTLFTSRMGSWWPLSDHSVSGSVEAVITFGPEAGGVVTESHGGTNKVWAEVLVHEPGRRVVLAWHPGGPPRPASQLDVRFRATGQGTEIVLAHSGWERYGARGPDERRRYQVGWDGVLAHFVEAARAAATL